MKMLRYNNKKPYEVVRCLCLYLESARMQQLQMDSGTGVLHWQTHMPQMALPLVM